MPIKNHPKSDKTLHLLLDVTPFPIAIHTKGIITYANKQAVVLMGAKKPEDLVGKNIMQFVHPDYQETVKKRVKEIYEKNKVTTSLIHEKLVKVTGESFDVEIVSIQTIYNNEPSILLTLKDISQNKIAEEKQYLLAAIVASSEDAIVSKTLQGIITTWNKSAERIFGYKAEEAIGKSIMLIIPDRLRHEEKDIIRKIRKGKRIEHFRTVRVRKDGKEINISLSISPIKNDKGEIIGAAKVARDITQEVESEENLKASEAKFKKLFYSNIIGVFTSTLDGTFLEANDAFLQIIGYSRKDLEEHKIKRDEITPEELRELSTHAVKSLGESGSSSTYEKEYIHKDGHRVPVLIAVTKLDSKTAMGFVVDITERKQLEKQKDDFLSMASHELKTPITSMKIFIDLLTKQITSDREKYLALRIRDQANRLGELTNDLLDISRVQANKFRLSKTTFNVAEIVNETVEGLQATTRKHEICIKEAEEIQVNADRFRIYQVLINLLTNAMKYSADGKDIIVRVKKDEDMAVVSVQDFGIGIKKELQEKIFERLYQVGDSQEKTFPGLGLGLYISKEIMERHKGKIWVESKKNKGSTFYFSLPLPK